MSINHGPQRARDKTPVGWFFSFIFTIQAWHSNQHTLVSPTSNDSCRCRHSKPLYTPTRHTETPSFSNHILEHVVFGVSCFRQNHALYSVYAWIFCRLLGPVNHGAENGEEYEEDMARRSGGERLESANCRGALAVAEKSCDGFTVVGEEYAGPRIISEVLSRRALDSGPLWISPFLCI